MTKYPIEIEVQVKGFEELEKVLQEIKRIRESNPNETYRFVVKVAP